MWIRAFGLRDTVDFVSREKRACELAVIYCEDTAKSHDKYWGAKKHTNLTKSSKKLAICKSSCYVSRPKLSISSQRPPRRSRLPWHLCGSRSSSFRHDGIVEELFGPVASIVEPPSVGMLPVLNPVPGEVLSVRRHLPIAQHYVPVGQWGPDHRVARSPGEARTSLEQAESDLENKLRPLHLTGTYKDEDEIF